GAFIVRRIDLSFKIDRRVTGAVANGEPEALSEYLSNMPICCNQALPYHESCSRVRQYRRTRHFNAPYQRKKGSNPPFDNVVVETDPRAIKIVVRIAADKCHRPISWKHDCLQAEHFARRNVVNAILCQFLQSRFCCADMVGPQAFESIAVDCFGVRPRYCLDRISRRDLSQQSF